MARKTLIPFFALLFLFSTGIRAQQLVASGGASHEGSSISLSWTIGENVIETYTGGDVILTQGFQQGYFTSNSIEDFFLYEINMKVYPNPVSEDFNLLIESEVYSTLRFVFHDIYGKILSEGLISSDLTNIDISSFPDGIYLLRVIKESGNALKSFRIIKN